MAEEAGSASFDKANNGRQERDEAKVGELTRFLQTMHGLVRGKDGIDHT
jgi:hypothetical protein